VPGKWAPLSGREDPGGRGHVGDVSLFGERGRGCGGAGGGGGWHTCPGQHMSYLLLMLTFEAVESL
jgi:hypothetical protein